MNKKEFTDCEEFRTVHAMRTLYARLIAPQGGLEGIATEPSCAAVGLHINGGSEVMYVAGDKKVVRVNASYTKDILDTKKYYGLHSFNIDGVSYLTAGFQQGIDIVNCTDGLHENKYIRFDDVLGLSSFKNIILVGSTIDDAVLFASHSRAGVIRVPLKEFDSQNLVRVSLEDTFHILLRVQNPTSGSQIRLAGDRKKLFVSHGSTVFEIGAGRHEQLGVVRDYGKEHISALHLSHHGLYIGSDQGKIYHAESVIYAGPVDSAITSIATNDSGIVFFTTVANGVAGPLCQLGGKGDTMLTTALSQVQEVQVRGENVFFVDQLGVKKMRYIGEKSTLVRSFEVDFRRPRTFCLEE